MKTLFLFVNTKGHHAVAQLTYSYKSDTQKLRDLCLNIGDLWRENWGFERRR
jgi:hypothetical protein